ncbi:hypothetical protein OsJ_26344 [Oryza sativa Japonica Group]|uniref:F-box domain-containing protein n=1 Tax=Oryza sativa subsp. japonica TaxID=39947 RepID=A3BQG5_ORYSJ|nr:hypothetical protein OsJ_26344 [Oryza sativa Japonica Group]
MPSSSSRRRRRRGRRRKKKEEEARDWADGLPLDAILAIFHKLGHADILMAADQVCATWSRAARDEPALWRRITVRGTEALSARINRGGLACAAVRRSAGQCEAFCGEYAGDDGFLVYLTEQASCLKSLRLISCLGVSNEGIEEATKEFPLLEELELSFCYNVTHEAYAAIGAACPQLKRFRLSKRSFYDSGGIRWKNNDDAGGISKMHGLRSLQLFANNLTNEGLSTILDNCPNLESLDIRHCFNIDMGADSLRAKCSRIKMLRPPDDSTDDYDFDVYTPRRLPISPGFVRYYSVYSDPEYSMYSDEWTSEEFDDDDDDYSGPSRYEEDLDKYDNALPRCMRTFLK